MRRINHKKGGKYFSLIGAFMVLSGILQYKLFVSADTPVEQLSVIGPVLVSAGLALIVIGFILVVFLFMVDY